MRGVDRRIVLEVGFGLALDMLGVLLILSGSVAAGVAVLVISTITVLGVILSRGGAPGEGRRRAGERARASAAHMPVVRTPAMAVTATEEETAVASTEEEVASMEVVVEETAAEVFRGELGGVMPRGWIGCYHAYGPLHDREGRR